MAINNLSFVIASKDPKELAEFYASLTQGILKKGYTEKDFCIFLDNGISIHIYKPSIKFTSPARGNIVSLCLNSEATNKPMEALINLLIEFQKKGALISQEPYLEIFGAEAKMIDPEGNIFLVFVPKKN